MKCPECLSIDTKVIDARVKNTNTMKRRRECLNCGYRFNTHEILEEYMDGLVELIEDMEPLKKIILQNDFNIRQFIKKLMLSR